MDTSPTLSRLLLALPPVNIQTVCGQRQRAAGEMADGAIPRDMIGLF